MANVYINDALLKAIAEAIRTKDPGAGELTPGEMAEAILALSVLDTSDATATARRTAAPSRTFFWPPTGWGSSLTEYRD